VGNEIARASASKTLTAPNNPRQLFVVNYFVHQDIGQFPAGVHFRAKPQSFLLILRADDFVWKATARN